MKDNLYVADEGRLKLISGIRKAAAAVGGTMGTGGHNAIIEVIERPGHMVTNDGITILESIMFADPLEDMGRKILLEAVSRSNKASGDGSSTCCVLTAAILEEGLMHLGKESAMEIKRSLEECVSVIEESINAQKREITVNEVGQVASISAEDEKIGAMIQEIYQQIGKDGIIQWDISKTYDDHYTIGTGITVEGAGFVSPYMADIDEKTGQFLGVAKWTKPYILLTKQKITSSSDFNKLFHELFTKEIKEVVVFCDEYEANVVVDLIRTRAEKGFKTLLIKMPVLWKDWWYEDLAHATGATVIDPILGVSFKTMTMGHLGQIGHITVSKEATYLDGIKDVSLHISALEADGSDDAKLRIARLNTKTARYFVGAASDSALSYKRLKVEDAISAAWQALQNGVVAGGGVALAYASDDLPSSVGERILIHALKAPMKQILENAGITYDTELLSDSFTGFDTRTRQEVNMFESGIVDPANVVLNAVKNAISVAASVLTALVVIQFPRPDITEQLIQAIMTRNPMQ